jgi:CBS domain-containing protein
MSNFASNFLAVLLQFKSLYPLCCEFYSDSQEEGHAMNASDIMSSPVTSVQPGTPVLEIAALLQERRFGGVPVLAGEQLVGIVTERDLLHRRELGTERPGHEAAWWRRMMRPNLEPAWYVKSHGPCAQHVMTPDVITAQAGTSLQEITLLFERHGIGRVPVMKHGRLVGIVASADLVRALSCGHWVNGPSSSKTDDAGIRSALLAELRRQHWWDGRICAVDVERGVVRVTGFYETEAHRQASQVAAQNTPGVRSILDDRHPTAEWPVMF